MAQQRALQDPEALEKAAKAIAADWRPIAERARKALVRRMPKNATYKMWQDDLMLIMTAAQGMHPVRDNFGAVKIIKTESEMPARVTTQTQLSSDGKTEVNVVDYLIMDIKTIVYRTHKTRASTGEVRQKIPDKVFKKIEASLVAYPREWLFTQLSSAGKPLKQQKPLGKGTGQIMKQKHVIGLNVNDARHDWITFFAHSKRDSKGNIIPRTGLEEDDMAKKMMTSRSEYQQYKRYGQYVG